MGYGSPWDILCSGSSGRGGDGKASWELGRSYADLQSEVKEPAFVITERLWEGWEAGPGQAVGIEELFPCMELTQRLAGKRPGRADPGVTTYWTLHYAQDFSVATYMRNFWGKWALS